MNKIILLFLFLSAITVSGQEHFPNQRPQLLLNEEVKVEPLPEWKINYYHGYSYFYSDEGLSDVYKKNAKYKTSPDAFGNRTFKVTAVEPLQSKYEQGRYLIKFVDTATNEAIYYKYNPKTPTDYYFNVINGGLKLPPDFYCDLITVRTAAGEEEFSAGLQFMYKLTKTRSKTKTGTKEEYELMLETSSDGWETGDGVTIELENNKKITRPKMPIVKDDSRSAHYYAFIILTPAEIALLSKNRIVSFMLYKYKGGMLTGEANKLMGALNCMLTK